MAPQLRKYASFVALIAISFYCFSQNEGKTNTFNLYEDTLKALQDELYKAPTDGIKYKINQKFSEALERALNIENSFNFPFDSLTAIARLVSPDKKLRIINWNLPHEDGSHEYYGYIQSYNSKNKKYEVFKLTDKSAETKNAENNLSDHNKWYGMLYYKIIPKKINKKIRYTLLAWDGNDRTSNKKIVDVLYFKEDGIPQFGDAIFKMEKKSPKRIIWEYGEDVVMSLKYNEKKDMIVFDHLAPPDASLKGQYQFYGPDFSLDGLKFEKGKWVYLQDVDTRNNKTPMDNLYKDPKGIIPPK